MVTYPFSDKLREMRNRIKWQNVNRMSVFDIHLIHISLLYVQVTYASGISMMHVNQKQNGS